MSNACQILAMESYLPQTVLTNTDLATFVDTSDEWIIERTGIRQRRRLSDNENASDMGFHAAEKLLHNSKLSAQNLTHIITATCTPDKLTPSVSCIIAGNLQAGPVMAFDVEAACTGFIYGLSICRSILLSQPDSLILFVCTEALTRRLNWRDRSTCVLFGDAAVACLLKSGASGGMLSIEDVLCQSDGSQLDLIVIGGGTSSTYKNGDPVGDDFFLSMRGRDTYRQAVRHMVNVCETLLRRNGLSIDDIALFVPHQANMRIIEAVGTRLKIAPEKVFTNVGLYGNTSAASIPLALVEACATRQLAKGSLVLVSAFGAGLTWGAALLKVG